MIPRDLVLEGEHVRLEPLDERHLASLRRTCNDEALFEFTAQVNPFVTEEGTKAWLADALQTKDHFPFAIVEKATGDAIGSTRYADIQPANRKIEIGWTFIAKAHWRSHVNTECKYALLTWAFESWNAVRVALKANSINMRSRDAIARIGATCEGTLRNFRINPRDGSPIHSSYYSILDTEWPGVKRMLEEKLDAVRTA
jgi:RimJ/RimL family protein N-acetyltransferase